MRGFNLSAFNPTHPAIIITLGFVVLGLTVIGWLFVGPLLAIMFLFVCGLAAYLAYRMQRKSPKAGGVA